MLPAIVVVAYNRPHCLKRILDSIARIRTEFTEIPLIISIDKSEVDEINHIANSFKWQQGVKKIISYENHLGLKEHILRCGDLTSEYGAVIILEDDLFVSPHFYDYTVSALQFYSDDAQIAGISLYSYEVAESCFYPFEPFNDGYDNYFIQVSSSWGQCWGKEQWLDFRKWYMANENLKKVRLPEYIRNWSDTTWEKHFMGWMLENNKFFTFPRISLTTNFGEPGTNADAYSLFQVPLQETTRTYKFSTLKDSMAVYDVFYEMLPSCLNKLTQDLSGHNFEVDLYGVKDMDWVSESYVLTTRNAKKSIRNYGLTMFPNVLNIRYAIPGSEIKLSAVEDVYSDKSTGYSQYYRIKSIGRYLFNDLIQAEADRQVLQWVNNNKYGNRFLIMTTVLLALLVLAFLLMLVNFAFQLPKLTLQGIL